MARLGGEILAQAELLISCYPERRSALLPLCHLAQEQDGWLTPEAMEHIAELVGVTPAEVLGTASFYDLLHTAPVGEYLVAVCTNIACLLAGGQELLVHAEERLGIPPGGTTADGRFSLEEVECIALCDHAPCAAVNWRYFGPLSPASLDALLEDLAAGKLSETVPPHGVLSRVRRARGLTVSPAQVSAERAASDAARAQRAQAAQEGSGGAPKAGAKA